MPLNPFHPTGKMWSHNFVSPKFKPPGSSQRTDKFENVVSGESPAMVLSEKVQHFVDVLFQIILEAEAGAFVKVSLQLCHSLDFIAGDTE